VSTTNKVLLACLLVVLAVAVVFSLRNRGGHPLQVGDAGTAVATPSSAVVSKAAATPLVRSNVRPTPQIIRPKATPAPALGASPVDEATLIAAIRRDILGDDPAKREEALGQLATLLTEGKGVSLMKELILSDRKDLHDDVLSLLPNLPDDAKLSLLSLALDAKDAEFRTDMLTAVRDVISSDPEKAALNDLLIKAMKDSDPAVQEEAADLFTYFGDAENDGPLYKAASDGLSNANETIRENAMSYLEDNQTVQSVLMLTEALRSTYPDIVEKAGDALRFTTDAEIPSNNYADWAKWCNENGEAWGKENDRTLP
jgi:hypothetical protein